jgi:hypothetical protein
MGASIRRPRKFHIFTLFAILKIFLATDLASAFRHLQCGTGALAGPRELAALISSPEPNKKKLRRRIANLSFDEDYDYDYEDVPDLSNNRPYARSTYSPVSVLTSTFSPFLMNAGT